jgi:hypothetical protein
MRELDCLVISTGRAASTATYKYMSVIGDLNLPTNKEPHFWCDLELFNGRYQLLDELYISEDFAYENLYRTSAMMIDASVGYFFYIDHVLEKLYEYNQKPKVLFLYREPLSRASSLFFELTKKGLEHAKSVQIALEIDSQKPTGLWWERYYDNVCYYTVFKKIIAYFDQVLAVNYDAFRLSPSQAMHHILNFMRIQRIKSIDYKPINTSEEALLAYRTQNIKWIGRVLPESYKHLIERFLVSFTRYLKPTNLSYTHLLPNSTAEYEAFRSAVQGKDYYDTSYY